ncbi:polysaccharide deacetylase family protein [Xanthobacter sp. ZOL 2024]
MSTFLASGILGVGLAYSQMQSSASVPAVASTPVVAPAADGLGARATSAAPRVVAQAAAAPARVAPASASSAQGSSTSASSVTAAAAAAAAVAGQAPEESASAPMQAPAIAPTRGFRFPAYTSVNVDGPYIAITFDDGPNPETTPKLMKILAARGVKATFFVVGTRASENPELLRQMAAAGHEIGNHSWNHPQLPKVSEAEADRQIQMTSDAIRAATGAAPVYLRPPYGAMSQGLRRHIENKFGLAMVYWSADSLDWKNRDAQAIYDKVMAQTRPGGIILMHDIHATTVAAVPRVLDALQAKGYHFVTVSQLIAMNKPMPERVAQLASGAPKPKKPGSAAKPASATGKPVTAKPAVARPKPAPQPVTRSSLY